jgi:hypothetical protein
MILFGTFKQHFTSQSHNRYYQCKPNSMIAVDDGSHLDNSNGDLKTNKIFFAYIVTQNNKDNIWITCKNSFELTEVDEKMKFENTFTNYFVKNIANNNVSKYSPSVYNTDNPQGLYKIETESNLIPISWNDDNNLVDLPIPNKMSCQVRTK